MSDSGYVSDDYYSSEEYIKSLLGIGEDTNDDEWTFDEEE